jgi:hypothetical protein
MFILLGHFTGPTIHYQPQPLVLQCHKTPSDNGQYSYRSLSFSIKLLVLFTIQNKEIGLNHWVR